MLRAVRHRTEKRTEDMLHSKSQVRIGTRLDENLYWILFRLDLQSWEMGRHEIDNRWVRVFPFFRQMGSPDEKGPYRRIDLVRREPELDNVGLK